LIGPIWPIPFHRGCQCEQRRIEPYAKAPHPFADFRKILDEMSPDAQAKAVGAGVYALLKSGLIEWGNVVTRARVQSLTEIVAWKQLTMDEMVAVGVDLELAVAAYEAVHTPEQDAVRQERAKFLGAMDQAGIPRDAVAEELARALLGRGPINVVEIGERLLRARDEADRK
jgi:hypothetical protein